MFWVALATAIMLLSGDGDGFEAYRETLTAMRAGIEAAVDDEARKTEALDAVGLLDDTVTEHWSGVQDVGDCFEAVDREYAVTLDDYARCADRMENVLDRTAERYVAARVALERAVPEDAWPVVGRAVEEALE